jgi:uncharacterized membrane protein
MPVQRLSPQSPAQRFRKWARTLASALLVVAGLILIVDPDIG